MSPDTDITPPESPLIDPLPPPDPPEKRIADLETELARARESLTRSERRREVDRLLIESGASDLEAASALVMEKVAHQSSPAITDEIRALKRRKPALFKRPAAASSMVARDIADPPPTPIESAAHEARAGGRAALLRYMRARRA